MIYLSGPTTDSLHLQSAIYTARLQVEFLLRQTFCSDIVFINALLELVVIHQML